MGDESLVKYEPEGRVAYITLNRPERMNAMNAALGADFDAALATFEADPVVRVAILRGAGRVFSAGYDQSPSSAADNKQLSAYDDRNRLSSWLARWLRIYDCPKPVVAQVHGGCFGGGAHIPVLCDYVAIADDAVLGWPKLPLGAGLMAPSWTYAVGPKRTKEMALIVGKTIDGKTAAEWGYANMAVPAAELAFRTRQVAEDMAKQPLELLRVNKLAINRAADAQGFRHAVLSGAEWDSIAHQAPCVRVAQDWITDLGLRGAIAKYSSEGL